MTSEQQFTVLIKKNSKEIQNTSYFAKYFLAAPFAAFLCRHVLTCRVSPSAGEVFKSASSSRVPGETEQAAASCSSRPTAAAATSCCGAEHTDGVLLTDGGSTRSSSCSRLHSHFSALIPSPPSLRFIKSFFPPFLDPLILFC